MYKDVTPCYVHTEEEKNVKVYIEESVSFTATVSVLVSTATNRIAKLDVTKTLINEDATITDGVKVIEVSKDTYDSAEEFTGITLKKGCSKCKQGI